MILSRASSFILFISSLWWDLRFSSAVVSCRSFCSRMAERFPRPKDSGSGSALLFSFSSSLLSASFRKMAMFLIFFLLVVRLVAGPDWNRVSSDDIFMAKHGATK